MKLSLLSAAPSAAWVFLRGKHLGPVELRKEQDRKLRAMVRHSYERVCYYNSLLKKAGITPDDIQTIDDLHKIPVTRKKDIIDLPKDEIVASDIDTQKCMVLRASGTSGTSLTVYWELKAKAVEGASTYLWQLECGDKMTARRVAIGVAWPLRHPFEKLGVFKAKRISAFSDIKTQVRDVMAYNPQTMHAFPSSALALGREAVEGRLRGVDVSLVFCGEEVLDDYTRRMVREAFDAGVYDSYASVETGRIYNECVDHQGFHIGRSVIVEITRDGEAVSPGEEGEVTVTNLDNRAMPFIRYDLEDLGVLDEGGCSCGNTLPRMRLTEGRKRDAVKLPDGRVIPAMVVTGGLPYVNGVKQFQVTQERIDRFSLKVVKGVGFSEETLEEVEKSLKRVLGEVEIVLSLVDDIPREKSGKFRPFMTRVPA